MELSRALRVVLVASLTATAGTVPLDTLTPRDCAHNDIVANGSGPGMVMALRLSHLGSGTVGVTWATPNRSLTFTPAYVAIVRWGPTSTDLRWNSTVSAVDLDKAEIPRIHRCNGVNPPPETAVQVAICAACFAVSKRFQII